MIILRLLASDFKIHSSTGKMIGTLDFSLRARESMKGYDFKFQDFKIIQSLLGNYMMSNRRQKLGFNN
ncbi:hypothetical protein CDG79_24215 [Nostoc sp. 'Peltigera membranacea cyanobiont' 232]|nr:hypothetical protein CDG79_24215 [Nostoc sp. 'Peltigera membranacea cyanobiont' 232]